MGGGGGGGWLVCTRNSAKLPAMPGMVVHGITYAHARPHTHTYIYVCAWKRGRVELKRTGEGDAGYIRLQTALVQRIFRRGAGPGRILRVASFLSRLPPSLHLGGAKALLLCSGDRVVPRGTSLVELRAREILLSVPRSIYPRQQQPAESSAERWKPGLCTCSTTESVASPFEKRPSAAGTRCLRSFQRRGRDESNVLRELWIRASPQGREKRVGLVP